MKKYNYVGWCMAGSLVCPLCPDRLHNRKKSNRISS